jgi:hypothetical protein
MWHESSVTRRLFEKSAQFRPNIAQNRALIKRAFAQRNLRGKFWNLEPVWVNFGRLFEKKNCAQRHKNSP